MSRDIQIILEALSGAPSSVRDAKRSPEEGGLPAESGLYAWWAMEGSIPGMPFVPHPALPDIGLLYVGIAPRSSSSAQTLRSRNLHNHIGGNTGSSTLRLTLAALLIDDLAFHPIAMKAKVVLPKEENKRLSVWVAGHMSLSWAVFASPWDPESEVIDRMGPPLNLAENEGHPYAPIVQAARGRFRELGRKRAGSSTP